MELKYDKTANVAIQQIKDRHYTRALVRQQAANVITETQKQRSK